MRSIRRPEFRRRRIRLMELMRPGSIALMPSAGRHVRNRDTEYPFRQDSDFYYLTGYEDSDALLVLIPGRPGGEVVLFCAERDPRWARYNGERLGPDRAADVLGLDDAFPVADVPDILPGMLEGRASIYLSLGEHPAFDSRLAGWIRDLRARESGGAIVPGEITDLKTCLHELRLIKSAGELRLMREAARITTGAHVRAMRAVRPGMTETMLEAELVHEFMVNGARSPAYPSIVAGGANACVLHYVDNSATLKQNDLVLVDAGAEFQHYASDVTRTFPVSGRFSRRQAAVYEVVLHAQLEAIAACRAGAPFDGPHRAAVAALTDGLVNLGVLEGDVDELVQTEAYLAFYPHKTSHWLGIDVHDVGDYRLDGTWRTLEPGMVLTVEPGLYFAGERNERAMGIRIEDDVLVTPDGPEVLTAAAPKTVDDIERAMRGR